MSLPSPSVILDGKPLTADEALQRIVGKPKPLARGTLKAKRARLKRQRELAAIGQADVETPPAEPEEERGVGEWHISEEEKRRRMAEIRKEWSPYERMRRMAGAYRPSPVVFTQTYDPAGRDSDRAAMRHLLYGGKADAMKAWSNRVNDGKELP